MKTVNLNIDYAAIIAAADKRRATLKEIEEEMQMLPAMTRQLVESLGYFKNLYELYNALDTEGQNMAGEVVTKLRYFGNDARNLLDINAINRGYHASLPNIFNDLGLEWDL